jgi:VWFA-related protein
MRDLRRYNPFTMRKLGFALLFFTTTAFAVEVPVTVIDRGGAPLTNLTSANFELLVDGKRQAVERVGTLSGHRNDLLVFDLRQWSPAYAAHAQTAARKLIDSLQANDRIAIATIDITHGFRFLTAFTGNRALLAAAVADPANFRAPDPLQLVVDSDGGMPAPPAAGAPQPAFTHEEVARELTLVGGLARSLRVIPGEKHLIFFSDSFDPRVIRDARALETASQSQQEDDYSGFDPTSGGGGRGTGVMSPVYSAARNPRLAPSDSGPTSRLSAVDQLANIARRSGVVVDAVNTMTTNGEPNGGLSVLTSATGGSVITVADIASRTAAQDVYVLSFPAPPGRPGQFHEVKIRLIGANGRVVAPTGYFEPGAESPLERTLLNAQNLTSTPPAPGLHVASLAAAFPTSSDRAQVPVVVEISGKEIESAAKTASATLDLYTYAFDRDGAARDGIYQRIALDLRKVRETLQQSGVKYYATLSLPPGQYTIRNLIHVVESDQDGYSQSSVTVPAKGMLAVSRPLFIEGGIKWLMIKGASHDTTNAPYPFQVNGAPFVPTTVPSRQFVMFLHNASPADITVSTTPPATLLSQTRTASGSAFTYELGEATSSLNVTVTRAKQP